MSRAAEIAELQQLLGSMRRCVSSLRHRYGDAPAMRRVLSDTERLIGDLELLDADAAELEHLPQPVADSGEKIKVPDTPYEQEFWRDVDDEGVGGRQRG